MLTTGNVGGLLLHGAVFCGGREVLVETGQQFLDVVALFGRGIALGKARDRGQDFRNGCALLRHASNLEGFAYDTALLCVGVGADDKCCGAIAEVRQLGEAASSVLLSCQ